MIKKYRWLITVLIIYYAVFYGCGALLVAGGNGAFILSVAGAATAFLLTSVLWKNIPSFQSDNLPVSVKRFMGYILLVSVAVQAIAVCTVSVSSVSDTFMKKSPFPYMLVFFIIPVIFAGYTGIKAVSGYAFTGGCVILFMIFLILIFAAGDYSQKNMYPVVGRAFSSPGGNIITALSVYANIFYLYIAGDSPEDVPSWSETGKALLISGITFTAICLVCDLIVPYEAIKNINDPLLYIASTVDLGFLVERSEGLVLIIRLFTSFICISTLMCLLCKISSNVFSFKDSRAPVPAFALIIFSGALLADKSGIEYSLIRFSTIWTLGISVMIPVIIRIAERINVNEE